LIAAPGTPKATVTPSRSSTRTAASIAFILAMSVIPRLGAMTMPKGGQHFHIFRMEFRMVETIGLLPYTQELRLSTFRDRDTGMARSATASPKRLPAERGEQVQSLVRRWACSTASPRRMRG
jgi:hypothetical protein